MAITHTDTTLGTLNINKFPSKAAFDQAVAQSLIGDNELSLVSGDMNLADIDDVTITSATTGQALTYNSSTGKWVNTDCLPSQTSNSGKILTTDGTTASWATLNSTITQLSSSVRIWSLDPGIYMLPSSSCYIYYYGTSNTSDYVTAYGGILNVWWGNGTTVKRWDLWTYTSSTTSSSIAPATRIYGSTTSSSGYSSSASYLTNQRASTNSASYDIGFYSAGSVSNFNITTFLATGSYYGTLTTSCTNKPANITLSSATYFFLNTKNSYSNYSYSSVSGNYIRQDLYLPTLNKHYYRIVQYYNSVTPDTAITGADAAGWVEVFETVPSMTGNANKVLKVNSGATGVEWGDAAAAIADLTDVNLTSLSGGQMLQYDSITSKWVNTAAPSGTLPSPSAANTYLYSSDGTNMAWASIGSITGHDFTHQTASVASGTTSLTVTFAANTRGTIFVSDANGDLDLTINCNNMSDNYIWISNTSASDADITFAAISNVTLGSISNIYMPSDSITVASGSVVEIGIVVNSSGAFITSRNDLALNS